MAWRPVLMLGVLYECLIYVSKGEMSDSVLTVAIYSRDVPDPEIADDSNEGLNIPYLESPQRNNSKVHFGHSKPEPPFVSRP